MMKKIVYICLLMAASFCFAQQPVPQHTEETCPGMLPTHPYYYCECRNTSRPFQFPLEVQVTDTMWFSATIDDMRAGLSAYWFADCSITFEIYAFCSSKVPTMTMTVGQNQMREMSIEDINAKLEQMGDQAELLGQVLTPRVRVYPNNGGSGTVYCFPYDQGPKSTCDSLLTIVPGMTYVCDQQEEVYELTPNKMSAAGKGFIRWKQKKNLPGTIRLTVDSCNGPEIANVTLSDSMRVYVLDSTQIIALKNADRSMFVHVSHDSTHVGRIVYRNSIKWDEQTIDTVICQGKSLQLADTVLTESTFFGGDTLWKKADSLSLTGYRLTIEPPTPVYDTLRLKAAQLPYNYRNNIIPQNGWGDYDFTIHKADRCDERYLLHVEHWITKQETVVDTTLCSGKTITVSGVAYSRDTVIRDSSWTNADTWTIRDITIRFTEPETEYDTISVLPSQMTSRGYWYAALGVMVHYGDTTILKTKKNTCTRKIQLHVGQDAVLIAGDVDTTLCVGRAVAFGEKVYTSDTTFYDTVQVDADTWMVGNITIHFAAPETEFDTVLVSPVAMTSDGYWYENLDAMVVYGDTLIVKEEEDMCTRRIQLHVGLDTTPIVIPTDTTLCLGKTFVFDDVVCVADTAFRDSVWTEPGLWMIHDITVRFTAPEMEYDTVSVLPTMMTPDGYWYENLDAMVVYGDTLIVKEEEDMCTRWIQLQVKQDSVVIEANVDTTLCLGKTLILGYETFAADTAFYGTIRMDEDTWLKGNIAIRFAEPEMEYDTVVVSPDRMTPDGYWYSDLETWLFYGDTLIIKAAQDQCTRWIQLHVISTENINFTNNPDATKVYKYLHQGSMYIRRGENDYDLLGHPVKR